LIRKYLLIGDGSLIVNEVGHIPREEENRLEDWVDCLVTPMFAQDVGGIGLAREVHHQNILQCYHFSNMMEGQGIVSFV
jgi:hypothetical protein